MKITITRIEGPHTAVDSKCICHSFFEADAALKTWSSTAPKNGAADKCDFTIVDETIDLTYSGRYDLKHWGCGLVSLKRQVIRFFGFMSGLECPPNREQTQYEHLVRSMYTNAQIENAAKIQQHLKGVQ